MDHKGGSAPKNWWFWIVVLEKTLENPLDCKDIKPVNPKGNQSWIFIGRTDAEVKAPILWPPDAKSLHIGKAPDVGKIEGNRRRGWQGISCLESIIDSVDKNLSKLKEIVEDRGAWCAFVHGVVELDTTYWLNSNSKPYGNSLIYFVFIFAIAFNIFPYLYFLLILLLFSWYVPFCVYPTWDSLCFLELGYCFLS